jgi:hypothetical protein
VRERIERERQEEKEKQRADEEKRKREKEHAAVISQMIKLVDIFVSLFRWCCVVQKDVTFVS